MDRKPSSIDENEATKAEGSRAEAVSSQTFPFRGSTDSSYRAFALALASSIRRVCDNPPG
jgi:hypothetical protein